jgi:hypothetical protein
MSLVPAIIFLITNILVSATVILTRINDYSSVGDSFFIGNNFYFIGEYIETETPNLNISLFSFIFIISTDREPIILLKPETRIII